MTEASLPDLWSRALPRGSCNRRGVAGWLGTRLPGVGG